MAISESLSRVIIKDVVQGYFRRFILDFLASMEACMLAWEIITVFQVYGIAAFGVTLYCNLLAKAYRYHIWKGISCPYTLIQAYVSRARYKVVYDETLFLKEIVGRICTQISGGLFGYKVMQVYWNLNLTPIHVSRAYFTSLDGHCLTFLNVNNTTGTLIG